MLGGQSGTPGAHFSRQWAHFGSVNAALYVATKDRKNSRAPTEWLQEKNSNVAKRKLQRRRRDLELNKKKNIDNAMFYSSEVYSKSKAGEGWMKCGECDLWAHKSVEGMNDGRSSVTFVTKIG